MPGDNRSPLERMHDEFFTAQLMRSVKPAHEGTPPPIKHREACPLRPAGFTYETAAPGPAVHWNCKCGDEAHG